MPKRIITVSLIIALVSVLFSGCNIKIVVEDDNSSKPSVTESTVSEKPETTSSVTSSKQQTTTSSETTASKITKPDSALKFKDSILNDMDVTFADMQKKYGKITDSNYYNGGIYYSFEKSNGIFFFTDDLASGSASPAKATDKCWLILTSLKDAFYNTKSVMKVKEFETALNCKIDSNFHELNGRGYFHSFEYKGYRFSITTNNDDITKIPLESSLEIRAEA